MSFAKYLEDELGVYGGAKAHDTKFLEMCVEKLEKRDFTLEEIIRKNLDQKHIIYIYTGSFGTPPLEHRIRLLKSAFARMVDEGLLRWDRWEIDSAVHYTITNECVKDFKNT